MSNKEFEKKMDEITEETNQKLVELEKIKRNTMSDIQSRHADLNEAIASLNKTMKQNVSVLECSEETTGTVGEETTENVLDQLSNELDELLASL